MTKGSAERLVISQPEPALYIQVPMFETSVAIHIKTFEQSDEGLDQPKADLLSALASGAHAPFIVPEFGEEMSFRCSPQ